MSTATTHTDRAPVAAPSTHTTTDRPAGTALRRLVGRLPLLVLQVALAVLAVGYMAAGWLLVKAAFTLLLRTVSAA